MAESSTANLGWTKPDPGASANTWGTTLNGTTDKIDAAVFALQQALLPVGTIVMYAGAAAPPNWMICDGRALVITTYQALYNAIQTAFNVSGVPAGNFNIPNLVTRFPLGAGPNPVGQVGGTFSYTIAVGNLPAHSHTVSDPQHFHYITDQAHNHSINQSGHGHNISTGGHTHSVSMNQHTHGYSQWATNGGNPVGIASTSYLQQNVGANTGGASDLSGSTNNPGNLGGGADAQLANISLNNSGANLGNTQYAATGIAANTGNTGSNTALSIVPPYQAVNYIIRYQ